MRIVARKCRLSGELFEESQLEEYAAHLRLLRKTRAAESRMLKVSANWMQWLHKEKKNITRVDDILPWFYDNQQYIMDSINSGIMMPNASLWESDRFAPGDRFENLSMDVKYSRQVSNSHVCPEQGTTNWCGHQIDIPRSYPGWKGTIDGSMLRRPGNDGSFPHQAALNMVGLLTGTGGGGNKKWSYEVSIFVEDWSGLRHLHEEDEAKLILSRLKGTA